MPLSYQHLQQWLTTNHKCVIQSAVPGQLIGSSSLDRERGWSPSDGMKRFGRGNLGMATAQWCVAYSS